MQAQFFGSIGEAAGKSRDETKLRPGATVRGLLNELTDACGESFREELFGESDGLRDDVTVTVNGAIIKHGDIDKIGLKPGDVIAFFPIFPGGG